MSSVLRPNNNLIILFFTRNMFCSVDATTTTTTAVPPATIQQRTQVDDSYLYPAARVPNILQYLIAYFISLFLCFPVVFISLNVPGLLACARRACYITYYGYDVAWSTLLAAL